MKRLYIIGPVSGKPDDNRRDFESTRKRLQAEGYAVDIPHDFIRQGTDWECAMLVSIHRLTVNCDLLVEPPHYTALYDGVAMLDGYRQSRGASLEKQIAEAVGIPCRPWRDYLCNAVGIARQSPRIRS